MHAALERHPCSRPSSAGAVYPRGRLCQRATVQALADSFTPPSLSQCDRSQRSDKVSCHVPNWPWHPAAQSYVKPRPRVVTCAFPFRYPTSSPLPQNIPCQNVVYRTYTSPAPLLTIQTSASYEPCTPSTADDDPAGGRNDLRRRRPRRLWQDYRCSTPGGPAGRAVP